MTDGMMHRYENLPEWLRWIICWPISLIFAVAFWWLLALIHGPDMFEIVIRLAHPVVVQVLFLVAIYFTVPRGKLGIVLGFIILRAVFLVFFVVFTPLLLFDAVPQLDDLQLNWSDWWAPFIGEVLTLAASVATYGMLREEHRASSPVIEPGT